MTHSCPGAEIVEVFCRGEVCASWCSSCGAFTAAGYEWRAPASLVLPGWTCECGVFNGSLKGLTKCRCCGRRKP